MLQANEAAARDRNAATASQKEHEFTKGLLNETMEREEHAKAELKFVKERLSESEAATAAEADKASKSAAALAEARASGGTI